MTTSDRAAQLRELVTAYRAVFDGLLDATDGLDDQAWSASTGCPGWDVHDQLAHCVGLERRLLGDPERDPDVEVPDLPHLTGEFGRNIERDVHARRGMPHPELRKEAEDAFGRRLAVLEQLQPDDLDGDLPTPVGPMRGPTALRLRVYDLACHERDIRSVVGRLEEWSGPQVTISVEQSLRAWARRVPARIEDAGTLVLQVDDAAPASLDLAGGDLRRDEAATTTADATIRLTAAHLIAIASGRDDAPSVDALDVGGDEGLARRFLAVASVTP